MVSLNLSVRYQTRRLDGTMVTLCFRHAVVVAQKGYVVTTEVDDFSDENDFREIGCAACSVESLETAMGTKF